MMLVLVDERRERRLITIMMSSGKHADVAITCPLDNAGILLHVLNNLGPGYHLFISAVSKAWRESYKRVASVQMAGLVDAYHDEPVMHRIRPQTTLCSAVFTSAALVRLAHKCGLTFKNEKLKRIAGKFASVSTLKAAHELGLQLARAVLIDAAEAASVPVLQWLHCDQGCVLPHELDYYAGRSGSIDLFRWWRDEGLPLGPSCCTGAAAGAHLHLLQYLREAGCEWISWLVKLLPSKAI
jgi:hypothetical protein